MTASQRKSNLHFGVTYDPNLEAELLAACRQFNVLEVKHISPNTVRSSILPVAQKFSAVSLHVQYLSVEDKPLTLNLANDRSYELLRDADSELYETILLLQPQWISFHAGFACAEIGVTGRDLHNAPASEVLKRQEVLSRLTRSLKAVQKNLKRLGLSIPLLVENLDYQSEAYEHVVEPSFLRQLMAQTGARLLLDLAHAVISAQHLGEPTPLDYVRRFLGPGLRELHVCAPTVEPDGTLIDVNQPFTTMAEVFDLLRYVLAEHAQDRLDTGPLLLTLECPRELPEQLQVIKSLTRTLYSQTCKPVSHS